MREERYVRSQLVRRLFRRFSKWTSGEPMDAITLFRRTWFFIDNPDDELKRHEWAHRQQQRMDGWKWYLKYGWWHMRHGYQHNPYEVTARMYESHGSTGAEWPLVIAIATWKVPRTKDVN